MFRKIVLFSLYAVIVLLIIFGILSFNVAGIYWFNNGIVKQADKLSSNYSIIQLA